MVPADPPADHRPRPRDDRCPSSVRPSRGRAWLRLARRARPRPEIAAYKAERRDVGRQTRDHERVASRVAGDHEIEAARRACGEVQPTPARAATVAPAARARATTRGHHRGQKLWLVLEGEPELLPNGCRSFRSSSGQPLSCDRNFPVQSLAIPRLLSGSPPCPGGASDRHFARTSSPGLEVAVGLHERLQHLRHERPRFDGLSVKVAVVALVDRQRLVEFGGHSAQCRPGERGGRIDRAVALFQVGSAGDGFARPHQHRLGSFGAPQRGHRGHALEYRRGRCPR
jgi:hypothetical protein